jgi:hypothetical protein
MDRSRLSAAQLALYAHGMPAIPGAIEGLPNLSGECDAMTADGEPIDFKFLRDHAFSLDEPMRRRGNGTAPSGKMTKAEKKRAKKQRIKGRLAIQAAVERNQRFFMGWEQGPFVLASWR